MRDYFELAEIWFEQRAERRKLYTRHDVPVTGRSQVTQVYPPFVEAGSRQFPAS